ncbi:hypothetical protein AB0P15_29115 [Streptomyces sp. NPDC087917]|uniref:hypothetical protein n=1 Tax=unclassified Streptomyces TaxID=2593676 RepID=UPI00344099BB
MAKVSAAFAAHLARYEMSARTDAGSEAGAVHLYAPEDPYMSVGWASPSMGGGGPYMAFARVSGRGAFGNSRELGLFRTVEEALQQVVDYYLAR